MKGLVAILILLISATATAGPGNRMVRWVQALTAPELAGRATGVGAPDAAAWLESTLKKMKLQPAGEDGYGVQVSVPWRAKADATLAIGQTVLAPGIEFQAVSFSGSGEAQGAPIFVGYGISAPGLGFDDYAGVDVSGRIIIAMTGAPSFLTPLSANDAHLASNQSKAAVALAKGALALVLVNDPAGFGTGTGQRPDEVFPIQPERELSGIMVLRVPHRVLTKALPALKLHETQAAIHQTRVSTPQRLTVNFQISVEIDREFTQARSLIAQVPNTSGPPLLLMAHYDGLSATAFDGPPPYSGADDNASGVVVLLEVASRLVAKPTQAHTVYVIFHDAEELGLMGAIRTSTFLRDRAVIGPSINLDMVGRLGEGGLKVFGEAQDCELLGGLTAVPVTCKHASDSHSDHLPFLWVGYPAVSISTGTGVDYHRSSDTAEKLNFRGMSQVADLLEKRAR